MTFLEKKLSRAWKSLFDRNSPGYLPGKIPASYDYTSTISKDLGMPIPSVGNLFLDNIPHGNATGYVTALYLRNLNGLGLAPGDNNIYLKNNSTSIGTQFTGIHVSGFWEIHQTVNKWTTRGWWIFKIPWREESTQRFAGSFESNLAPLVQVHLNLHQNGNPDQPPTTSVGSLRLDVDRIQVQFSGNDSDSNLLASVANLFSTLNTTISDTVISTMKSMVENDKSIKKVMAEGVNLGLRTIWTLPL